MNNKNILFIAYFFPPAGGSGLPGANRIIRFIKYLKVKQCYVLTINPENYPEFITLEKNDSEYFKYENIYKTGIIDFFEVVLKIRQQITKICFKKSNITTTFDQDSKDNHKQKSKNIYQKLKDAFSLLLNYPDFARPWLIPAIFKGIRIARKNNIDIIFATGMPWTALIIGYFIKIFTSKKLIIDFRDPWVGNPYVEKSKLEGLLDRIVESKIIHKSDHIIANTNHLVNEFCRRYPKLKKKFLVVPNGYDKFNFNDIPKMRLPKDKLNIVHAGLLYLKRNPITLLQAIANFKNKYPQEASNIQFIQIGGIVPNLDLEEYCKEIGIHNNIIFLEQMNHKNCLGYLSAADILLIIQPNTLTQIPSKLYEYIYLEKPILTIAEKNGALAKLISDSNLGRIFSADEYEILADFLYSMLQNKMRSGQLKVSYYNKSKFDSERIINDFQLNLNKLSDVAY